MKFKINEQILDKIEVEYNVAFLVVENLIVANPDELSSFCAERVASIQSSYKSEAEISNIEQVKLFDKLIHDFGLSKYGVKSSIQNMLEMVCLKSKNLVMGQSIIDAYNIFVLNSLVPAGAYDLDRVVGNVELRFSSEADRFKQLNKENFEAVTDTVVFADESEVLCNHFVYKQSETQKIRPSTKNVLFRFEGVGKSMSEMKSLMSEFKSFLKTYFKFDDFEFVILNKENPESELKINKNLESRRALYLDSVELLSRGVSNVIVYEDVLAELIDGKKLKIKHGVDPTTKDLHIGYAVIYEKLRQFQERGHKIQFLIGSFTARFGDPTDKGETRTMRDKKVVMDLAKNYIKQLGRILNTKKLDIFYNGDWFDKMSAEDMLRLMSEFTVARMLERDMFAKRMKEGKEIGLHEIVYPMLQGYDSVEMESDLTIIGTDQTFNELQARPLQTKRGQKPQNIIAMDLLVGTDGKMKMSQSLGNYIGFEDLPEDKFGKVMSIPDSLIYKYFEVCTRVTASELKEIREELSFEGTNPRDLKMRLAFEIVKIYDGEVAANRAKEHFVRVFKDRELPVEMPEVSLFSATGSRFIDILISNQMIASAGEGRRLIMQGGIKVNSEKITDINFVLTKGGEYIVQIGKRKFLKVTVL